MYNVKSSPNMILKQKEVIYIYIYVIGLKVIYVA